MREDNDNGDLCKAATVEGTVSCFLFPLPRHLLAVLKLPFQIQEGKKVKKEEFWLRVAQGSSQLLYALCGGVNPRTATSHFSQTSNV